MLVERDEDEDGKADEQSRWFEDRERDGVERGDRTKMVSMREFSGFLQVTEIE